MDLLAVVGVLVAAGAAGWAIAGPLRGGHAEAEDAVYQAQLEDLEAAKEARYREIREAEMDFRTGKLSEADYKAIDRQLRAEAVELLRRLDALGASGDERVGRMAGTTALRPPGQPSSIERVMFETILSVVQVAICIVLIFLVLMHSGKDAGLSGAFGVGSGQGSLGGGSLVERNLNRWTVFFAVLFAVNTIILLKIS